MTETDGTENHDPGVPVEKLSYSEASRELDSIVHFFEQRDVDVDQLVGRLVRATALVEELDKRLRQTRLQVEQLVPRLTAVLSDTPPDAAGAPEAPGPAGAGEDEVDLAEAENPFLDDTEDGAADDEDDDHEHDHEHEHDATDDEYDASGDGAYVGDGEPPPGLF